VIGRSLLVALLVAVASVLAGCSGNGCNEAGSKVTTTTLGSSREGGTNLVSSPVLLPTRGTSGVTMQAAAHGTLQSNGRCFWVGAPTGSHVPVIWPHGYTARTQPLRVLDDKGHVIGRVGDTVDLAGGEIPLTRAMLVAIPPSTRQCFGLRSGLAGPQTVWFM
jgi:hypothetical protein